MIALAHAVRRPDLWPAALVVFLLHGGALVAALPVLVLPSTVGVATFFGPTSVTPAGPSPSLVLVGAAVGAALLAWGALGGLAAAAAETAVVRSAVGRPDRPRLATCARIVGARALTSLPLLLAAGWSAPRLGAAAYAQLTHPSDPSAAFVLRVFGDAPETVAALIGAWLLADALGAVAARRIALLGDGVLAASWRAVVVLVRRPVDALVGIAAGPLVAVAVVGATLLAARTIWDAAGRSLMTGGGPVALGLVAAFVAVWALALALAGVVGTWRSATWVVAALGPTAVPLAGPALEPAIAEAVREPA